MAYEEEDMEQNMDSNAPVTPAKATKQEHHAKKKHHHAKHAEKAEKSEKKTEGKTCSSSCAKTTWMVMAIVFFLAAIIFLVLWLTNGRDSTSGVGEEQIKVEMKKFIDENLLQAGMTSTVDSVEDLGGIYKLTISVAGQTITSYATKDGKIFFPSGLALEEATAAPTTPAQAQQPPEVPKTDKPVVEVFVMSHCPYGTQIEKGLLPVVSLLGDKADIQIKFVNYAMHGQKEVDEQLNQYCIQQEYPDDYYKYLQCFLNDSNTARCMTEMKFSQTKIDACITAADAEFGISKDFADKSTWKGSFPSFSIYDAENIKYGVQGSPTLVINGKSVSSARDSQSLKNAICAAFNDAPAECDTALPTASPSPGFGYGTSGSDAAAAQCG
ncbi:MAG: hypothetical protein ACP5N3_01670 [Candidatus Nanoarchaeia archaeon]